MIEIQDYRSSERLARSLVTSWWLAETHTVDHFAKVGFPVRIESIHEVGQLLDTMQERRFEIFLTELGGLSSDDVDKLCGALLDSVKFQLSQLPKRRPLVPFSTMISSLALYKKIVGFKFDVDSILEIGPGCGYLSFFLARHSSLQVYSQVEACESFYILQSMINSFLFGHEFQDLAIVTGSDQAIHLRSDVDTPLFVNREHVPARCIHFPWWKLNSLFTGQQRYDVVTSNANLNEFTNNALRDYLAIFRRVMKDDGLFMVQCTGFPAHGTLESLFDILHEFRFAPLFCALAANNVQESMRGKMDKRFLGRGWDKKSFALNNLLMVKETHPLFGAVYGRQNYRHGFAAEFNRLESIYKTNVGGTAYSRDELLSRVEFDLKAARTGRDLRSTA